MTQKIRAINIANNSLKAFVFDASLSAAVDAAGTVSAVAAAANVAAQAVNTFVTLQTQSLGSVRPTINSITFYANSSYVASNTVTVNYLIVGGGGGGGASPPPGSGFAGGGGGAGGFLSQSTTLIKGKTYAVSIGAGGTGGCINNNFNASTNGTPSSLKSNQNDFIEITGSNFQPSSIVMVGGGNTALSTTVVSPTLLRAQISNTIVSGTYTVYVINNTTGATGIRVNGITLASNTISFGGGAGSQQSPSVTGSPGGSGGGTYWTSATASGLGTPGQGYPGGLAPNGNGAAGGGGAGGTGGNYPAGHGGTAALWPYTNTYYAGGGGGGAFPNSFPGPWGGGQPPANQPLKGGGGDGGYSAPPVVTNKEGRNGIDALGGGGGGGLMYPAIQTPSVLNAPGSARGGNGGAGTVVFAIPTPQYTPGSAPTGTVTNPPAAPGMTVITFLSSGTFTP